MDKLRGILIGFGYWGPNIARNISASDRFTLSAIVDLNEKSRMNARKSYPHISVLDSFEGFNLDSIDVVFIATPASTHFQLAKFFLNSGKHIWVEKPATINLKEAEQLIHIAKAQKLKIFVDHPYVYSPIISYIRENIHNEEFGKPLFFNSTRANLGIFQPDISVAWDLAVHDLSILNTIFPEAKPLWISCFNGDPMRTGISSVTTICLEYDNGLIANINCNWLSPIKIRTTIIGGQKQTYVFDDTQSVEKLRIYEQEFESSQSESVTRDMLVSYRSGDMKAPRFSTREALAFEMESFSESIEFDRDVWNLLDNQIETLKLLEAADQSHFQKGLRIYVN